MDKLVLFDIDKTLIKSSKGHSVAFSEAFKKIYGIDTNINIINHHGMTDQQIIIEVLKKKGLNEAEIRPKLQECMRVMSDSFNQAVDKEGTAALDGVSELLEELDKHGFLIGVVTGNLELIARGKLKRAGIEKYFKVGGFGSDNIDRAELVRIAVRKAEENFGFRKDNNVFLFGDTPKDMMAGKEGGATTIGVTTGIYSKEQLAAAGANFTVESLTDKRRILEIMEIVGQSPERKTCLSAEAQRA